MWPKYSDNQTLLCYTICDFERVFLKVRINIKSLLPLAAVTCFISATLERLLSRQENVMHHLLEKNWKCFTTNVSQRSGAPPPAAGALFISQQM